jgi:Domain of unknown function (DUF4112)
MSFTRAGFAGFRDFGSGFAGARDFAAARYARARRPYDAQSRRAALDRLDMLATLFDTAFILPGIQLRFGVESLLRLVPGIGDAGASMLSCYLLYEAHRLGVPRRLFARMVMNVLLEGAVGVVPVAGDAFDVIFRANRRNVALLREHFAKVGY